MTSGADWQSYGSSTADRYVRYLVPGVFYPWGVDLIERAAVKPGERVLDVACGPGVVTRLAAERAGPGALVAGLDINRDMLQAARTLSEGSGEIAWHEGSAVELPFPDESFEVVLCQQGLQFFPDRSAAVREMRRVLVSGGRLVLSVWASFERNESWRVVREVRALFDTPESVAFMDAAFSLGDPDTLRSLVAEAGFEDVRLQPISKTTRFPAAEELPLGVAGSTLVETDPEKWSMLADAVRERLRPFIDDEGLRFTAESNVVMARTRR